MLDQGSASPEHAPLRAPILKLRAHPSQPTSNDYYKAFEQDRDKHVSTVLQSPSRNKIIVAGPGTGKTYIFKKALQGKRKALTLSFINALVEDLSLELCGLSDVRTLHSFACQQMQKPVFPRLSQVIQEDAVLLLNISVNFDEIFHNMQEDNEHISFYKARKNYYAHYGYSDIVYATVQLYKQKPVKVPTFDQIVVDEFQDFNRLEVALINLLAAKSPILIAGDDDQALYDFKGASPQFIRHCNLDQSFSAFKLPYCSRSTRVIVDAVSDVIETAKNEGHLPNRIDKPYRYFECEKKDRESRDNPSIIHTYAFETMIPSFIERQMSQGAAAIQDKFSTLVIHPVAGTCQRLADGLRARGFRHVQCPSPKQDELTLLDGLNLLLINPNCNLGWRIAAKFVAGDGSFTKVLKQSHSDAPQPFSTLLEKSHKAKIKRMLTLLRSVRDDSAEDEQGDSNGGNTNSMLNTHEFQKLLTDLGLDPYEAIRDDLQEQIVDKTKTFAPAAIRKLPIQVSTVQGSKGLAADYVFITGFDDAFFIKDSDKSKISEQDICKFLVALTRARKRVFLISTFEGKEPTFLRWIDKDRVEKIVRPKATTVRRRTAKR